MAGLISSIQVLGQSYHYIPYSVISNMAGLGFAGSAMTSRSRLVATAYVCEVASLEHMSVHRRSMSINYEESDRRYPYGLPSLRTIAV